MKILLMDGYNLLHRSRHGFAKGPYNIVYNFFRSIRPIIEKFSPDKVYFVLEGYPKERFSIYPEYKQNRKVGMTPEKIDSLADFRKQREIIYDILKHFPFEILSHPDYECDDVIAMLAVKWHPDDECVIISRDTDFIQLHEQHDNICIYDPVVKDYLEPPSYDYASWKSLVGDTADNIKGIPRVGKKTATKILTAGLNEWLCENPDKAPIYHRNMSLIQFHEVLPSEELEVWDTCKDFGYVKEKFADMEFDSILKESTWKKYVDTFEDL